MFFFTEKFHRFIYILALAIIACALPYSIFVVNAGIVTLSINWAVEAKWRDKIERFKNRPSLWVFLLIYLSIIISASFSDNISHAIREVQMWLPVFVIPVIVVTSHALSKREFQYVLLLFSFSIFYTTIEGLYTFIRDYDHIGLNVRYLSPYIAHIRLAILINISIVALWYLSISTNFFKSIVVRVLLLGFSIWFIAFLLILQSVTGIIIFVSLLFALVIRFAVKSESTLLKFGLLVCLLSSILLILSYLTHETDKYFTRHTVNFMKLPGKTVNGNSYLHDTLNKQYENGNLVWINICRVELNKEWNKKSDIPFDLKDKDGNKIEETAIRYLTSKGLTKDSVGLSKLDSTDIKLIENGVSSVIYREHKMGIYPRFYQLLWEIDMYKTFGTISGSSVVQRYVFLRSTWELIKKNVFFGVGVGDSKDKLLEYYENNEPNLKPESRKSSHNQYLFVWLSSGIFGLGIFLLGLLYPFIKERAYKYLLPLAFIFVLFFSMFSIETFELFLGSAFVAFFYSIFIFGYNFEQDAS